MNARELKMKPADLVREQSRQLAARKQHDKRVRVKAAPRVKAKADREQAKREETARIRRVVEFRDLACVICMEATGDDWEMHHADSGSGKSQRQTVRNCFKTHEPCHKRAHRGDLGALGALRARAAELDFSETVAALDWRIAKICESRQALHGRAA
jgi:hypothetical protein